MRSPNKITGLSRACQNNRLQTVLEVLWHLGSETEECRCSAKGGFQNNLSLGFGSLTLGAHSKSQAIPETIVLEGEFSSIPTLIWKNLAPLEVYLCLKFVWCHGWQAAEFSLTWPDSCWWSSSMWPWFASPGWNNHFFHLLPMTRLQRWEILWKIAKEDNSTSRNLHITPSRVSSLELVFQTFCAHCACSFLPRCRRFLVWELLSHTLYEKEAFKLEGSGICQESIWQDSASISHSSTNSEFENLSSWAIWPGSSDPLSIGPGPPPTGCGWVGHFLSLKEHQQTRSFIRTKVSHLRQKTMCSLHLLLFAKVSKVFSVRTAFSHPLWKRSFQAWRKRHLPRIHMAGFSFHISFINKFWIWKSKLLGHMTRVIWPSFHDPCLGEMFT